MFKKRRQNYEIFSFLNALHVFGSFQFARLPSFVLVTRCQRSTLSFKNNEQTRTTVPVVCE